MEKIKDVFQGVKKLYEYSKEHISSLNSIALNNISDLVLMIKVEESGYKFLIVNEVAKRDLDIQDDAVGKNINEILTENLTKAYLDRYNQVVLEKNSVSYDESIEVNGEVKRFHSVYTPILDETEKCKFILEVKRDISDRRLKEQEIENSYAIYKSLINYTSDAISILDVEGRLQEVNTSFEHLYGWKAEEVYNDYLPTVPDELIEETKELLNRVCKGESVNSFETMRKRKDGTIVHVSLTCSPIYNNDSQLIGISSIVRNIEEKKQTEKRLNENKARFESLFEYNPEIIISLDLKGNVTSVNPTCEQILGYTNEEMKGQPILHFVDEKDLEIIRTNFKETVNGKATNFKLELWRNDKIKISLNITCSPIIIDQEIKGVYCIGQDITENEKNIISLENSEQRYRIIAENSQDLITVHDPKGIITYASPSHEFLIGYLPKQLLNKKLDYTVHPDDLPEMKRQFYQSIMTVESFSCHLRKYHNQHKKWIWYEVKGSPVLNSSNEIDKVILVAKDISIQKEYEGKLKTLAFYDELTKIPNRRLFQDRLQQALAQAKRYNKIFSVLFLDGDGFKKINDELGHDVGDQYLIKIAERCNGLIREEDTVARMGGDEFAILLSMVNNEEEVEKVASRLRKALNEPVVIGKNEILSSFSIGIAMYPQDGIDVEYLLKSADQALYFAKNNGKNSYQFYNHIKKVSTLK